MMDESLSFSHLLFPLSSSSLSCFPRSGFKADGKCARSSHCVIQDKERGPLLASVKRFIIAQAQVFQQVIEHVGLIHD